MVLDIQPNDILPEASSSPTTSTSVDINNKRRPSEPTATIVEPPEPSHSHLLDLQTVSIKLPSTMAVLVVPVNLSSINEDDSMQLQQIGRRVAIIRGSMTNVAEFQVLPAMNLDENSRLVETDIRQIVTSSSSEKPENGPTIQIIPNATEVINESEVVDEEVLPPKPKPKSYLYIEGIHCGRCLKEFNDLTTLATHQKSVHKMRTIDTPQLPETKAPDDCQASLEAAQIEDKIAARGLMGRANLKTALALKKLPTKRVATGTGTRNNNTTKGGRGGKKATTNTIKSEMVFTCHFCSLTLMNEDFYKAHLETHQAEAEDPMEEFMDEFVEEEEVDAAVEDVKPLKKKLIKAPKYTISTPTTTPKDEKHAEGGMGPTEHIITDSSGNQIMVHADTPEQLQELLASLESGSELVLEHHQEEEAEEEEHVMMEDGQVYVLTDRAGSVAGGGLKTGRSANRGR